MIPVLTRTAPQLVGVHDAISRVDRTKLFGTVSPDLRGDARNITGTLTADLVGDVSGITGDVTGLRGDVTGLSGNLTLAQITQADRDKGIPVSVLTIK